MKLQLETETIPQLPHCPAPCEVIEFYDHTGVAAARIVSLPFSGSCLINRRDDGNWQYITSNGNKHGRRYMTTPSYSAAVLAGWKWACRRVREEQRKLAA